MNIKQRKREIIRKYGTEQSISYYFVLWNPIAYAGEQWVRDTFESVQGIGYEPVTIADYSSDDGTKELAEEYGFRVITVPKDKGVLFNESKCQNAMIHNSKSNFLCDLSIQYNYPKIMEEFNKFWLSKNIGDIVEKVLILRGKYFNPDGSFGRYATGSWMIYRPYWLAVRGFDERCVYPWGGGPYATRILLVVLKLKIEEHYIGMEHKKHLILKHSYWRDTFNIPNKDYNPPMRRVHARGIARPLEQNFDQGVKQVKNSYW